MKQPFDSARYLTSVAKPGALADTQGLEIAFSGRSNSGKSTTLNAICRQKSLARTSKTPGRTQMINYFAMSNGNVLVDLPGYGYAKAPPRERDAWAKLVEFYFSESRTLRGVVIVRDIRRPLQEMDCQMIDWCEAQNLPLLLLLNKADKLKKGPASNALLQVKKSVEDVAVDCQVLKFSAFKKTGLDELHSHLNGWLNP